MRTKGLVFDIQRGCTHDGPGLRTTVFLKGCPLRCRWCHNPESWRPRKELFFRPSLCIDCQACGICPFGDARTALLHREHCYRCFRCADACTSGAIEVVGRDMTVSEVLEEVQRDAAFYEVSGGGLTLSGGEPFSQSAFALAVLRGARRLGISTCVETCGYAPTPVFEKAVPLVDLFLWDIKETDPDRHRAFTGGDLDTILANLRRVDALGARTQLRCLLVEGANAREDHLSAVQALAKTLDRCVGIEYLTYHPLGAAKYVQLGMPSPEVMPEVPAHSSL